LSSTLFSKPFSTKVDCNEHMNVSDINHMIGCETNHPHIISMPKVVTGTSKTTTGSKPKKVSRGEQVSSSKTIVKTNKKDKSSWNKRVK
jgi:hypothetical protein